MILFVLLALFHDSIISKVPEIVGKLWGVTVFPYMWMFLLGVFLCENKEHCLGFLKKTWIPLMITAYIFIKFVSDITLVRYGLVSSTLSFFAFLGFAYQFPKYNLNTDISYAVYVYHMVIVNAFIALDLTRNVIYMFATFIITFAISYLSTKTIGEFGLKKKKNFG